jgi:hypothetical protein
MESTVWPEARPPAIPTAGPRGLSGAITPGRRQHRVPRGRTRPHDGGVDQSDFLRRKDLHRIAEFPPAVSRRLMQILSQLPHGRRALCVHRVAPHDCQKRPAIEAATPDALRLGSDAEIEALVGDQRIREPPCRGASCRCPRARRCGSDRRRAAVRSPRWEVRTLPGSS